MAKVLIVFDEQYACHRRRATSFVDLSIGLEMPTVQSRWLRAA
jgi:hypothetical protein